MINLHTYIMTSWLCHSWPGTHDLQDLHDLHDLQNLQDLQDLQDRIYRINRIYRIYIPLEVCWLFIAWSLCLVYLSVSSLIKLYIEIPFVVKLQPNISIWCTEPHPVVLIICSKQDMAVGPLPFDMIDIDPWDLKNEWWRVVGTPYHPKKPRHRARETENGRGWCTHFQCIFRGEDPSTDHMWQ